MNGTGGKDITTDDPARMYDTAVEALLSPTHQATTKEEIAKSAARRTRTVQDMRYYWNKILRYESNKYSIGSTSTMPLPKMIHITGTKGKGSTACFCESVLRSNKYKTGLLTSPHLLDIRERIRWNGKPIHPNIFGDVYWTIRRAVEETGDAANAENDDPPPTLPGYFRMLTLMGYYTFFHYLPNKNNKIDILIVEVGMGGRYDATNFFDPSPNNSTSTSTNPAITCGVTLLDLDHVRILGDTLEKIAWEKGGIFARDKLDTKRISERPGTDQGTADQEQPAKKQKMSDAPAAGATRRRFFILDSNTESVMKMIQLCATIEGQGAELVAVDATGKDLRYALGTKHQLGLPGDHQYGNAMLADALCRQVTNNRQLIIGPNDTKTLKGLQQASWPGRCQIYNNRSKFMYYLDGAHTPQSIDATCKWFQGCAERSHSAPGTPIVLVFNTSHERDPYELLSILTSIQDSNDTKKNLAFSRVYFAKSDSSRPSPVAIMTLQEILQRHNKDLQQQQGWSPFLQVLKVDNYNVMSWQDTLAGLYQHFVTEAKDMDIHPNLCAAQILEDLQKHFLTHETTPGQVIPVFVTGSLYLVGSFLKALNWKEDSSPTV